MLAISSEKKFDLHTHTNASDGSLAPEALLQHAIDKSVDVLAITDHDTVLGFKQALVYLTQENERLIELKQPQLPIHLIAGIELSTTWQNRDIHVVGLGIDIDNPFLKEHLDDQALHRYQRAQEISDKLSKSKVENALAGVEQLANGGMITRAHFAKWLVENRYATSPQKAFNRYLKRGRTAYVPSNWRSIDHAVDLIHKAGGQAVLAHPSRYDLSAKWVKRLLADFVEVKGDAMEVAHAQQTKDQRQLLTNYAKQFNLLASQGSDFHYQTPWIDLGRNLYLDETLVPVWHQWML